MFIAFFGPCLECKGHITFKITDEKSAFYNLLAASIAALAASIASPGANKRLDNLSTLIIFLGVSVNTLPLVPFSCSSAFPETSF